MRNACSSAETNGKPTSYRIHSKALSHSEKNQFNCEERKKIVFMQSCPLAQENAKRRFNSQHLNLPLSHFTACVLQPLLRLSISKTSLSQKQFDLLLLLCIPRLSQNRTPSHGPSENDLLGGYRELIFDDKMVWLSDRKMKRRTVGGGNREVSDANRAADCVYLAQRAANWTKELREGDVREASRERQRARQNITPEKRAEDWIVRAQCLREEWNFPYVAVWMESPLLLES